MMCAIADPIPQHGMILAIAYPVPHPIGTPPITLGKGSHPSNARGPLNDPHQDGILRDAPGIAWGVPHRHDEPITQTIRSMVIHAY